jgi:hypothetical protein
MRIRNLPQKLKYLMYILTPKAKVAHPVMIYGVKIMKIRAIENLTKANFLRKRINDLSHTSRTFACCCPEEVGTSLGTKETAISFRLRLRPLYTVKKALKVLTNEKRGGVLSKSACSGLTL